MIIGTCWAVSLIATEFCRVGSKKKRMQFNVGLTVCVLRETRSGSNAISGPVLSITKKQSTQSSVEHRMIALCTYCLLSCSGTDVVDVMRNHVGTLIKQGKKWNLVENATRRKLVNGALKLTEHKYSALFANMQDAFAYHNVLFDEKGRPVDYVFLETNEAFEKFTGLKKKNNWKKGN